jgi:hypothetical protein
MGRQFKNELKLLEQTMEWVENLDLNELRSKLDSIGNPFLIVGSGGSYSACLHLEMLLSHSGKSQICVSRFKNKN